MHLQPENDKIKHELTSVIHKLLLIILILLFALLIMPWVILKNNQPKDNIAKSATAPLPGVTDLKSKILYWIAPDVNAIKDAKQKEQIAYGKDLIAHTSKYLGPNGSILKISNGLNCQNCHLQAGTVIYGNNYGSVAPLYPKFRARRGSIENIYKRITDCIQRSLNGKAIDTNGKEMQAIAAYINYLGSKVTKGEKAIGSGFKDITFLDRAANPINGKLIYSSKCQSCHQANGEGVFNDNKTEYKYPALWGNHSFNSGAGLSRLSNFAKFVKYNMPQGVTFESPQLTDEEAWDLAAYVLSMPRPRFNISKDWPDISKKPFDHPYGPYSDKFTERQHKLGPFKPIIEAQKKNK